MVIRFCLIPSQIQSLLESWKRRVTGTWSSNPLQNPLERFLSPPNRRKRNKLNRRPHHLNLPEFLRSHIPLKREEHLINHTMLLKLRLKITPNLGWRNHYLLLQTWRLARLLLRQSRGIPFLEFLHCHLLNYGHERLWPSQRPRRITRAS